MTEMPPLGPPSVGPPVAPPPTGFPPPAKSGMNTGLRVFLIAFGILAVLGVGLGLLVASSVNDAIEVGDTIFSEVAKAFGPAPKGSHSVEITECSTDSFDHAFVSGTITNTSGQNHGFEVKVGFYDDSDTRIGSTSSSFVDPIDGGRSASFEVGSFETPAGGFTCRIEGVDFNGANK